MENIYFETGRLAGCKKESNLSSLIFTFIHTFLSTILSDFSPLLLAANGKKKPVLDIGL